MDIDTQTVTIIKNLLFGQIIITINPEDIRKWAKKHGFEIDDRKAINDIWEKFANCKQTQQQILNELDTTFQRIIKPSVKNTKLEFQKDKNFNV